MESTVTPESSIRNQAPKVVQCSKVYKAVLFFRCERVSFFPRFRLDMEPVVAGDLTEMHNTSLKCVLLLCLLLGLPEISRAQIRFPEKPGEKQFITDEASLLSATTSEELKKQLGEVLRKK